MAASNRHWPSLFKSKPHQQWQNDSHSNRSSSGCEERAPEPKPRWNPLPEQVRILEAIFHSGMVNPPRDEIRRIRTQLQEYGQVGDANVFYWFQNRKSRSKSKKPCGGQTNSKLSHSQPQPKRKSPLSSTTTTSSSERSSHNSADKTLSLGSFNVSSPTASVNQPFLQARGEFLAAPFLFPPVQQPTPAPPPPPPAPASFGSQGFCFPDPPATGSVPSSSSLFLGDLLLRNHAPTKKAMGADVRARNKVQQPFPNFGMNPVPSASQTVSHGISSFDHLQGSRFFGLSEMAAMKSTIFINDVGFEVASAGFNVREAFGEDAILLHPSGQPVLTNEWGLTLYPLQHGASYYLMRTLSSAPNGTAVRNLI